jgi:outer membrane biosynthesis protein TonB
VTTANPSEQPSPDQPAEEPAVVAQTPAEVAGQQPAAASAAEEELRAAYEAELSRATTGDLLVQVSASLINLGARRLGLTGAPESEHDLAQVRDAIDSVRVLLPVLERTAPAEHLRPLRDALAQLQMAFAREVGPAPAPGDAAAAPPAPPAGPPPSAPADQSTGRGPAESSGRLWVPGRP